MIILKQKPLDEILEMTRDFNSLLIAGCDGCASVIQVGGEKQAEVMKALLEMARKLKGGSEIKAKAMSILRQCDRQITATTIRPLIEDYDVVLSLGCGAGVQTLVDLFQDKVVIPANDTKFIGMHDRETEKFHELCSACGNCILFETGGVCPVTRCAKGIMNGPCGGCVEGKCEVPLEVRDAKGKVVETIENDCAWYLIYERLKKLGRLDLFRKYRPPRNRAISSSPRIL